MDNKKSFWADMPPMAKGIIGVLGTAAVIFAGWKTYKWLKRKQDTKGSTTDVNQSQSTLNTLGNQGIKMTYPPVQYTTWANTMQQAMDGCGPGWATQLPIWTGMKNDADVHALIVAYGTRTVDKCGVFTGDFTGDLAATLAYKFSGVEGSVFSGSLSDINSILKKNGVTFKF